MPLELNLPALRKDGRIRSPAHSGAWSPLNGLNDLSAALAIEAGSMKLGGIKSVPHTWGHIIVFETALLDEHHPGHQDAIGQWRGLLAMLALRNRPGFSITADPVELQNPPGAQGDTHRFTGLAAKEQPKPQIDSNCTWDPVHLLYAEADGSPNESRVLVGTLSPSTIVAPARDFSGHPSLGQFWARQGLRDPLAHTPQSEELSPDELEVCRLFTMHVLDRVRDLDSPRDSGAAEKAVALLKEFAEDLEAAGAANAIATWTEKALGDLVAQDPGGLYGAVNSVWMEESKPDITDLLLGELNIGEKTSLKIVLADPRCVQTLGQRPHHISLFGSRTLADLPAPAQDGAPTPIPEHLRKEAGAHDILLLGPEDLLADRLTMLEGFQTSAHPEAFREHLLPVKAAALLLYENIDELAAGVDLLGSTSRPRAGLRVTLKDRKGDQYKHLVTREYKADAVERANPPEALAAWPDFRFPRAAGQDGAVGWKLNYLFTSTNISREPPERAAIVTTGLSREMLDRDLARVYRNKQAAGVGRRLEEWSSEVGPWPALSGAQGDGRGDGADDTMWFEWLCMRDDAGQNPREKNLQRSDSAFEGALFRLPTDYGSVYAGLGMLPRARDMSTQEAIAGGTAQISLDFGTSNTIVYCKRGDGEIKPLPFSARLRRFNEQRDDDGLHADLEAEYTAFMPSTDVKPPFATVMQVRSADGIDEGLKQAWTKAGKPALWRDYAFFDPNVLHLTESLLSGRGRSNLIFDLKWGDGADDRSRMGRYLRHICMLALAEVVGSRDHEQAPSLVEWRLSYPITAPYQSTYQDYLKAAPPPNDPHWSKVECHTESQAALDYFREVQKAQPQAMLVLDIGGGSTDIALATREKGVWQNSVRLAGDDLMTEFLLYNRAVLETLELAHIGKDGVFGDRRGKQAFMHPPTDQPPADKDRNAAKAIINSPVFARVFAANWLHVKDDDALRLLKAGASMMMGGLCAFLGLQVRALLKVESAGLDATKLTSIRLCFGGRGATMFKLLKDDPSFKHTVQYLTADLGLDNPPELDSHFSQDMKHEVAKGMLAQSGNTTKFPDESRRILGVGIRLGPKSDGESGNQMFENTAFMEEVKGRLPDGTARDGVGAPEIVWDEFDQFLVRLGRDAQFSLTVRREARDDITSDGNYAFSRILSGQGESEPPFIAMLRKTLSLLYEGKGITVDWNPPQDR